jgi:cholesterol transport system auxiliary component
LKRRSFLSAVAVSGLAGCSIGPQPAPQPALYDFGIEPPAPHPARLGASLALAEVTAGPALQTTAIVYRLAYRNPARLQPYSLSRWAAPPAVLVTQRLRLVLARSAPRGLSMMSDGLRGDYLLRVGLDVFEQVVDAPAAARGVVRAQASLVSGSDRRLVAQRAFDAEQPCPSVDAEGAVSALSAAADVLVAQILDWVAAATARKD